MKILLISANNEQDPYPVAPLGVAYIAAFLKGRGDEISLLDLCFVEDDNKAVEKFLSRFKPDIIGISIRNIDNLTFNRSLYYLPRVKSVVDHLKNRTSAPIVVGGSGYSIFPLEILQYLGLEIGITGEGETAFGSLVDAISSNSSFDEIQNLCFLKNGEFQLNETRSNDFDYIPDRSLLENEKYFDLGGMANIQTKRGCPFNCSYCTYPSIDGSKLRLREPEVVVDELLGMKDAYGMDYAFFVDDIFNYPEDHAAQICEEILRRDLIINWTCFATPLGMTQRLAELMRRAGCKGVEFGSDAATDVTLKGLGKQFTVDEIAVATEVCNKSNLPNAHYLIIGGPGEDYETLSETFNFFDKVSPTAIIALTGLRIYPKTLLQNRAIDDDVIDKADDLLEPIFYLSPMLNPDEMSRRITEGASQRHNWIVPGFNIRSDPETMKLVRKMNSGVPLWSVL